MLQVKYLVLFCALILYTTCEGGVFKEYDLNQNRDKNDDYYLSNIEVSYYDALQMCHEKDMQLVSIETSDKNKRILKFLNGSIDQPFWTSGNKISSGAWTWLKGESFEFENFKEIQHYHSSNIRCRVVSRKSNELFWNIDYCDKQHRFICEKLKEEVTNPKCEDYSEDLVHGNTLPNKKYYIGKEIITYSKALQVCRSKCMRLVSIESEEKNRDLFEAFVAADATEIFWSSGHLKPANVWQWTNGKAVDFVSWNKGEPNNARKFEFCMEILKNDDKIVWNDQPCEDKRMYVCETIDKENDKA